MQQLNLEKMGQLLKTRFVGRHLIHRNRIGSSMDLARREAARGAAEGSLILAEEQTAGRGRFGRPWLSPPGENLYLTLIMRPEMERLSSLSIITPLAVCLAVEETTGLYCHIKWPNDILIGERKLAGVLIESALAGDEVHYALIGIGLNVNLDVEVYPDIAEIATSLKRELGREIPREQVLATLLNRFEEQYAGPPEIAFAAWQERLETLGRQIRVRIGDEVEEGLAEEVDAKGSLILRRADGSRLTIPAGEVTLRG